MLVSQPQSYGTLGAYCMFQSHKNMGILKPISQHYDMGVFLTCNIGKTHKMGIFWNPPISPLFFSANICVNRSICWVLDNRQIFFERFSSFLEYRWGGGGSFDRFWIFFFILIKKTVFLKSYTFLDFTCVPTFTKKVTTNKSRQLEAIITGNTRPILMGFLLLEKEFLFF